MRNDRVVIFLTVLALSGKTLCGEDDPPPTEQRSGGGNSLLSMRPRDLTFEAQAGFESRRVGGSPGRRAAAHRNRDLRFEQALSMRLDGHLISSAFLTWQGGVKIGLSQERFQEEIGPFDRTDADSGLLLEHDLSIDLLPGRALSFHAYSRQVRDRIGRRFLPSLLEERREAGISAFYAEGSWTTELGLDWSDTQLTGNRLDADDETFRTLRFHLDNRWEISAQQHLRVAYDHQRERSTYQGSRFDFDTRRDQVRIEHDLSFGPESKHQLDTFVRFNHEQGDLARDELEITPRLTLDHGDGLQTVYRYSFYRVEQDAIEIGRHKADVQAVYRVNDGLRLTADLFWLREAVEDDIETYQFGGSMDVSYRRKTQRGELLANVSYTWDREETVGSAGQRIVRGEAHALDPARPTFLNETDIRLPTLQVYNGDRTRLFIAGVDYVAYPVGRRTAVLRLLSGRIAEGESVYFDYRFRVPSGARIDSHRVDLRVEHAFSSGWAPYYDFELRRQSASGSRARPVFEDRTERHRFGLRYDRPDWSAGGEIELFSDTIEPYDAYRLDGRVALLRDVGKTLDATARASWFDFKGGFDARRVWWIDLGLNGRFQHDRYLSSTLATVYRWENDSRDGTTDAIDVEYGLRFRRGLLEVDLTVEYDLLALEQDDEGFGVWLTLRRDLTHLLPEERGTLR